MSVNCKENKKVEEESIGEKKLKYAQLQCVDLILNLHSNKLIKIHKTGNWSANWIFDKIKELWLFSLDNGYVLFNNSYLLWLYIEIFIDKMNWCLGFASK